MSSKQYHSRPM